jgi:hypothetical protein
MAGARLRVPACRRPCEPEIANHSASDFSRWWHWPLPKYFPGAQPGSVSLEGFVDAMVMVEGLKHAGRDLTREGLIRAIETIHRLDLGLGPQLKLDYSSHDHAGLETVIPTVIRGGRAVPFTDWVTVK